MKGNLQLQIPAPCHEDWDGMRPEAAGRYCRSCAKTVVDFSMMTDQEVIGYLARAGAGVCGRFASEQLNKNILPVDKPRRYRGWWHWVVAGMLVTAEARGQAGAKGEVKVERREARWREVAFNGPFLVGDTVLIGEVDSIVYRISPAKEDSPKVKVLDTVKVIGYGTKRCWSTTGAVVHVMRVQKTVAQTVMDSLAAVGLLPKRELAVYPNPARRGSVVSLQWQRTEPGTYEVSLFNAAGELVEQRKMEVGGKEQVDLLHLPPALPAGMYFLRAARPGGAKVITLRIIVV